jgi:hypothetical protein
MTARWLLLAVVALATAGARVGMAFRSIPGPPPLALGGMRGPAVCRSCRGRSLWALRPVEDDEKWGACQGKACGAVCVPW